jgi:hypothetical protein
MTAVEEGLTGNSLRQLLRSEGLTGIVKRLLQPSDSTGYNKTMIFTLHSDFCCCRCGVCCATKASQAPAVAQSGGSSVSGAQLKIQLTP